MYQRVPSVVCWKQKCLATTPCGEVGSRRISGARNACPEESPRTIMDAVESGMAKSEAAVRVNLTATCCKVSWTLSTMIDTAHKT